MIDIAAPMGGRQFVIPCALDTTVHVNGTPKGSVRSSEPPVYLALWPFA